MLWLKEIKDLSLLFNGELDNDYYGCKMMKKWCIYIIYKVCFQDNFTKENRLDYSTA
jgi:hypothetical protein